MTKYSGKYYPYREDAAGKLKMKYQTSKASEALLASPDIISLAEEVLSSDEYDEAEEIAQMLTGTKVAKQRAHDRLIEIVAPPPKRPIYYCQYEMTMLPNHTRDGLRYLGDFVDMMVKSATYEKTQKQNIFHSSLGPAITQFSKAYPNEIQLVDWLSRYNQFLYRGAKHDMILPKTRSEHRYTSREVVLAAFITMQLAHIITQLSPIAAMVRNDQPI